MIAAGTAVVALVAAIIGAFTDWYGLKGAQEDIRVKQRCHVSGTVYSGLLNAPTGGVRVGYINPSAEFSTIAVSRADGTYGGTCQAARRDYEGESVELFVLGRYGGESGGLPCLTPRATGIDIEATGRQEGVELNLSATGC